MILVTGAQARARVLAISNHWPAGDHWPARTGDCRSNSDTYLLLSLLLSAKRRSIWSPFFLPPRPGGHAAWTSIAIACIQGIIRHCRLFLGRSGLSWHDPGGRALGCGPGGALPSGHARRYSFCHYRTATATAIRCSRLKRKVRDDATMMISTAATDPGRPGQRPENRAGSALAGRPGGRAGEQPLRCDEPTTMKARVRPAQGGLLGAAPAG